ncbi:MAG TPA: hypothetical protein VK447_05295, partial [Myxococcaceae bacterium]|nr:hypothetical protein [Myxococcaceae bacterium]
GRKTALRAGWHEGAIALRVPEALLASSAYPAVLDPVISPEQSVDSPVNGPSNALQISPSVAFNGTGYLVVWQDDRAGVDSDIYGTRVAADGTVLDTSGIAIKWGPHKQRNPTVASDGSGYLVVWEESGRDWFIDIHGARVAADGTVLDPEGFVISAGTGSGYRPRVASNGAGYLVVWSDGRNRGEAYTDIYGARVGADGVVLDPEGLALCACPRAQEEPSVASDGSGYLVAWEDVRSGSWDIYGTRVSADGTVHEPSGLPLSTVTEEQVTPAVASNGAGYLVAWNDTRGGDSRNIYATRVGSDGAVHDPSGLLLSTLGANPNLPAVASNGTGYLVAWERWSADNTSSDLMATRVGADGAVLDPAGLMLSRAPGYQRTPALTSNGTGYLVVWGDSRGASFDIYAARVTADGRVEDSGGLLLTGGANNQTSAAVASNGTGFLVAWTDDREGFSVVYAVRLGADGAVLDPSGLRLGGAGRAFMPSVASNRSGYLVAWQEWTRGTGGHWDLYATRVSASGTVQDPGGLAISIEPRDQRAPSVGSDGSNYLIAWTDYRSGNIPDVYATVVGADGRVHHPSGVAISADGVSREEFPSVGSNGDGYLVAWADSREGVPAIHATRVTRAGEVRDPSGLLLSMGPMREEQPVVASNGSGYLVAWTDARGLEATRSDIYATRVSPAGAVEDSTGLALCAEVGDQGAPRVAVHGSEYLVAWEDQRAGGGRQEVYATRVAADGTVRDPSGVVLSSEETATNRPAVAVLGNRAVVAYDRFDPGPGLRAYRVRTRVLTLDGAPPGHCGCGAGGTFAQPLLMALALLGLARRGKRR